MHRHPEQRDGEIYLGNTTVDGFHKSSWSSKRMGNVARYQDGRTVDSGHMSEGFYPWFIQRADVEQQIASIAADTPNREERVRTFQAMLADDFDVLLTK